MHLAPFTFVKYEPTDNFFSDHSPNYVKVHTRRKEKIKNNNCFWVTHDKWTPNIFNFWTTCQQFKEWVTSPHPLYIKIIMVHIHKILLYLSIHYMFKMIWHPWEYYPYIIIQEDRSLQVKRLGHFFSHCNGRNK